MLYSVVFCRIFDKVPKSRNNPHINTEPIIALTLLDCKNVFLMHPSIRHQIRTRYMMVLHHFTQNNAETAIVCGKIFNFHFLKILKLYKYLFTSSRYGNSFLFSFSYLCRRFITERITDTYIVSRPNNFKRIWTSVHSATWPARFLHLVSWKAW